MVDPRLADHAQGLELQLVDLVARRDQALHDGWRGEAETIDSDIEEVQAELAATASRLHARRRDTRPRVRAPRARSAATRPDSGPLSPGSLVFTHALALAVAGADEDEAVAELLALARRDRTTIERARSRWRMLADEQPEDVRARNALRHLERALRGGDEARRWSGLGSPRPRGTF
jgi:hypothetical protein